MTLVHVNNIDWVEKSRESIELLDASIIREFVLRTPAIDVSCRSEGFIARFRLKDSADAEVLFDHLLDGVDYYPGKGECASSAEEVEKILEHNQLKTGEFWSRSEFAVFTVSSFTKRQVSSVVDSMLEENIGLKDQKRKLVKKKFQLVDSLFRHIRNSLAHGSFQVKECDSRKVLILQDSNENGEVSSRMVLNVSRLLSWITDFYRFEVTGV